MQALESLLGNIPGSQVLTVEAYKAEPQRGSQTALTEVSKNLLSGQAHFPAVLIRFLLHQLPIYCISNPFPGV